MNSAYALNAPREDQLHSNILTEYMESTLSVESNPFAYYFKHGQVSSMQPMTMVSNNCRSRLLTRPVNTLLHLFINHSGQKQL